MTLKLTTIQPLSLGGVWGQGIISWVGWCQSTIEVRLHQQKEIEIIFALLLNPYFYPLGFYPTQETVWRLSLAPNFIGVRYNWWIYLSRYLRYFFPSLFGTLLKPISFSNFFQLWHQNWQQYNHWVLGVYGVRIFVQGRYLPDKEVGRDKSG